MNLFLIYNQFSSTFENCLLSQRYHSIYVMGMYNMMFLPLWPNIPEENSSGISQDLIDSTFYVFILSSIIVNLNVNNF